MFIRALCVAFALVAGAAGSFAHGGASDCRLPSRETPRATPHGVGEDRDGRCTIWNPAKPTALGYHPFGRRKGC